MLSPGETYPGRECLLAEVGAFTGRDISVEGMLQDLLWAPVAPRSPDIADHRAPCSADQVPRWRLAREGPFLAERSPDTIRSFGAGCAFRNTIYRVSDYASPSGEFGLPMHHPRFIEWIPVPHDCGTDRLFF